MMDGRGVRRRGGPVGEMEETAAVRKGRGCGVHSMNSTTSRDLGSSQVRLPRVLWDHSFNREGMTMCEHDLHLSESFVCSL